MEDKITEIMALLDRGDSSAAAKLCDQWREAEPQNALAWNISGLVDMRHNDLVASITHFEQAVALSPDYAKARCNLGIAYQRSRRTAEALFHLQAAATQAPTAFEIQRAYVQCLMDEMRLAEAEQHLNGVANYFQDLFDFGMLEARVAILSGRLAAARDQLYRLAETHPSRSDCWVELGKVTHDLGDLDASVRALRQADRLVPDHPEILHWLGVVLLKRGDASEAVSFLRRAQAHDASNLPWTEDLVDALIACHNEFEARALLEEALVRWPQAAGLSYRLGRLECGNGNVVRAEALLRAAMSGDVEQFLVHHALGSALAKMDRSDEALIHFEEAIRLNPDYADSFSHLGNLHWSRLRMTEAEKYYRRAIEIDEQHVAAHANLGLVLLATGRLQEGWREYAWRLELPENREFRRDLAQVEWQGESLRGKRLLVHAEQGMGDTLQFVRYLPRLRAEGAYIILECQAPLKRLLTRLGGVDMLLGQGEPLPEFDLHIPLLSLPRVLGTTLDSIPADMPYLDVAANEKSFWQQRVEGEHSGLRVGIVWAGNSKHANDRKRSIAFASIEPLLAQPGVKWFSLQKELPDASNRARLTTHGVIDWTGELKDFADTAGLIESLDFVITVDTSVAHLAGALGLATWVMLPHAPDWRWLLDRADTPWYPAMRLFRQKEPGDWSGVIDEVAQRLRQEVARKTSA